MTSDVPFWYKDRVTAVSISPYRDGLLMHLIGPGIAANIAFHLFDDDDDDRILHEFFPNLGNIYRRRNSKIDREYGDD